MLSSQNREAASQSLQSLATSLPLTRQVGLAYWKREGFCKECHPALEVVPGSQMIHHQKPSVTQILYEWKELKPQLPLS